jgi:LDH2 family malate/lactate/ureidoglycolate dehydrogenase
LPAYDTLTADPAAAMARFAYSAVEAAVRDVLVERAVPPADAGLVACVVTQAEARGYASQGLRRVSELCSLLDRGLVKPTADLRESRPSASVALLTSAHGVGHPVAVRAIDLAAALARDTALAMVGVVGASHIGYLTFYVERAAQRGLFAIATTVSSPAVAMPGSGRALFGTNPLAFAFPTEDGLFCADLSLARVSRGEVIRRKEQGARFPAPVGYDKAGNASSEPSAILEGGIAPLDDSVRGVFINMLVSIMAGPLIGGVANPQVVGTRWFDGAPNKGDLFICIDIARLTDRDRFAALTSALVRDMQAAMPAFHVPGDYSRKRLEHARRHGLMVKDEDAAFLRLGELAT